MYREIVGQKEINISHDLSDRSNMRKERVSSIDNDIFSKIVFKLRTEKR